MKITQFDAKKFVDSLEIPLTRLFVERSSFGDSVGYFLPDGRGFDLAIDSQELEKKVIEYLLEEGVEVKNL